MTVKKIVILLLCGVIVSFAFFPMITVNVHAETATEGKKQKIRLHHKEVILQYF